MRYTSGGRSYNMDIRNQLNALGLNLEPHGGKDVRVHSPVDGLEIAALRFDTKAEITAKIARADAAFRVWKDVPAPVRGRLIRLFGEELRAHKEALAQLVTIECGKIISEARGEVQEMIDICNFALGLSRQLHGLTIASERPQHVMQETWLPLGAVGVISAFNFPVAVWCWNFALAIVCGDPVVWKPSEKTPVCALACNVIFGKAAAKFTRSGAGFPAACGEERESSPDHTPPPGARGMLIKSGELPEGLCEVVIGAAEAGEMLVNDPRLRLISATGSCRMGEIIAPKVLARHGKLLLELGGNNAVIVSDRADMELALQGIVFGAVGTAGQRCTTTRRVLVQKAIYEIFCARLQKAYSSLQSKISNPLEAGTLVGPLIDKAAFEAMQAALAEAKKQGGEVFFGERAWPEGMGTEGYYVHPALVKMPKQTELVQRETFAPIVYVIPYTTLAEAIAINNDVPQGLSSAIFTTDLREAEFFKRESDCGFANVNIGTSGAEVGGAFGGEKATGGGREAGSDSWKNYMRRQTSTTYYGTEKPALAQGVEFDAG